MFLGGDAEGKIVENDFVSAHDAQVAKVEQGRRSGHGWFSVDELGRLRALGCG